MSPTSTLAAALLALQCAAACARFAPPPSVGRRTRGGALWRLRGGAGEEQLADSDIFTLGDSAPWLRYVRTHGVLQFISILRGMEDSTGDELLWGDEIEYHILATNASAKTVRLSLRAPEVLAQLSAKEQMLGRRDGFGEACAWHPEYGAWMVEGTPRIPYGGFTSDLCRVEPNMRLRRKRLASTLGARTARTHLRVAVAVADPCDMPVRATSLNQAKTKRCPIAHCACARMRTPPSSPPLAAPTYPLLPPTSDWQPKERSPSPSRHSR